MPFILTFYSFKGGVGRTVLAANAAALLAKRGKKTLLWDLDIEAPGLHRIDDLKSSAPNKSGFFEWLRDWQDKRQFAPPTQRDLAALAKCLLPVDAEPRLHILPAHGAEASFTQLFGEINWHHFLAEDYKKGLELLRQIIAYLAEKHDFHYFVLDSRTGITDIGGLLTALLPNLTILVGNYGVQNTAGLAAVWKALQKQRDHRLRQPALGSLRIDLVASPVPRHDPEKEAGLRRIWEKDFGLAEGSLCIVREDQNLREGEKIFALSMPTRPIVEDYARIAESILATEASVERDATDNSLAIEQRRDLYDPTDPRLKGQQGKRFEERVADLLRMLGYRVEPEQTLNGNRIDLIATLHQGLDENVYLVECKDHKKAIGKEIVETLDVWLRTPGATALNARGMIVARRFSPQAIELAKARNIRTFTPEDLERKLVDFAAYLNRLISEFAHSPLSRYYVEQKVEPEKQTQSTDLLPYALAWARGEGSRLWVLLGDYGTGKTAFTRRFAYELAQQALGREDAPIPLLINLKDYPNKTRLGDILHEHWHKQTGERRDPAIFLHLLGRGRLLLLLDSFDEMGISQAHRNVTEQFRILAQPSGNAGDGPGANRVLVTCREQFFREHDEALHAINGQTDRLAALEQAARGFDGNIDLLPHFDDTQIKGYLGKRMGETEGGKAWEAIDRLYNLKSLADRPQLLDMIIESLPDLMRDGQMVSPGVLYLRYTNRWLEDPAIHPADRQSSADELRVILEALAIELWRRDGQRIHHADLYVLISQRSELRGRHDPATLDVELRTAAFLSRSPDGYYAFSHRSFLEFFHARALLRPLLAATTPEVAAQGLAGLIAGPKPSRELCEFFADLLATSLPASGLGSAQKATATLLADPNLPAAARRNAYLLTYWVNRKQCFPDNKQLASLPIVRLRQAQAAWLPAAPQRLQLADCHCNDLVLPSAQLAGANLDRSHWARSDLDHADLSQASARDTDFHACRLRNTDLSAARLAGSDLSEVDATGIILSNTEAKESRWIGAKLLHADLDNADFEGADLRAARLANSHGTPRLTGAHLEGCTAAHAASPALPRPPAPLTPFLKQGHAGSVNSVAFSPDGQRFLSGSADHSLRLWDAESSQEIRRFDAHQGPVWSVAFSPDGRRLLSGGNDHSLRLWDAESGQEIRRFDGHQGAVLSGAFSPNGRRILSGGSDSSLRLWDAESGQEIRRLDGHQEGVQSVAFSSDGRRLLSGGNDDSLHLWDAESSQKIRRFDGHQGAVTSVAFSPDGEHLLSSSIDKTLRLWDAKSGQEIHRFDGHQGVVLSVAFSPDGQHLLSGGDDSLRLWDAESGQEIRRFDCHWLAVRSIAFSRDGQRLLSVNDDDSLHLWDAESGQEIRRFDCHQGTVLSVTFSPDGQRLLSGGNDHSLRLWDAESGQEIRRFDGHQSAVRSVAFSPDGRRLLSGGNDHSLRLWDAESGQEICRFDGHQGTVLSVAFSPDGRRLLSGGADNTLRLWDAESGRQLRWCWAGDGQWFSLEMTAFHPAAVLAELPGPVLRGSGSPPLAFVEAEQPILPAPWIPRHWLAEDLPELWFPEARASGQ